MAYYKTPDNALHWLDDPIYAYLLPSGSIQITDTEAEQIRLANQHIPQSVTRAQARAALILAGLIGQVQPSIDAIVDPTQRALVQNDWDNRLTFERNNSTLLGLAAAMGLTDAQLDALFTQAAAL